MILADAANNVSLSLRRGAVEAASPCNKQQQQLGSSEEWR